MAEDWMSGMAWDGELRTVADLVRRSAERTPNRLAVVDGARRVSWEELWDRIRTMQGALLTAGLTVGDRIVIQLPTGLDLIDVYLGAMLAGIVAVPVNPAYTLPELRTVLAESGARALVTASVDAIAAAQELTLGSPGTNPLELVVAVFPHASNSATPPDGTRSLAELMADRWQEAINRNAEHYHPRAPVDPESLAVLLFTSGTSGRPKGAMLTHRALLANIEQGNAIQPPPTTSNDVIMLPIPLFHIYGLNAGLGIALSRGSTVVLVERFEVGATLRQIVEEGVTVLLGAPAMFAAWLHAPDFGAQLSGVRFALSGSAPLSPALVDAYGAAGVALHEGYGLTEAASIVTSNAVDKDGHSRIGSPRPGSVGAPLPGVEISLRDADGSLADEDDPGRIAVRGANLFSGYWPDGSGGPDADGWFITGDLGYLDSRGDLVLVGRDSELVLVNGFNVYPAEIEAVFAELVGVGEAAVVGVPDDLTGEALVAYVVPRVGASLTVDALLEGAARSLARFKLPRRIEIVTELPHTVTGKVKKWQLRSETDPA